MLNVSVDLNVPKRYIKFKVYLKLKVGRNAQILREGTTNQYYCDSHLPSWSAPVQV